MNPKHSIAKVSRIEGFSFPARVFSYLALCEHQKLKMEAKNDEDEGEWVICPSNLPLFSEMTRKYTPEGVIYGRFSFLKYCN